MPGHREVRKPIRPGALALGAAAAVLSLAVSAPAQAAPGSSHERPAHETRHDGHCGRIAHIVVPGAAHQESACLPDLTTSALAGTLYTDRDDWAGLHASGTELPTGVPGIQLDGYFPDGSTTNPTHGWDHDSQFVLRLPDNWNGGLIVSGSPGNRQQYANDVIISDRALARGYAYAATDKGNTGLEFYRDGRRPGDAVAEWNRRVTQLTLASYAVVAQRYGQLPRHVYAAGISNGGYLVRWQLENRPWLYDGGIDWEGTLFTPDGPNLFTYLPDALRAYPDYRDGEPGAHERMIDAGFAPGSEFLWDFHHDVYWELTQRIYREEFDPGYDGDPADYDYAERPESVHKAVARVSLTGEIRRPMITLHGTLDTLLPIATDSDVYAGMIDDQGRGGLHRYYRIENGNHVDGLYDRFPERLRPMLPCFWDALTVLESWVERGTPPPPSHTIPYGDVGDPVNACSLGR